MQWRRGGEYWITSECGYRVSKSGTGASVVYTAWAPRLEPNGLPVMLRAAPDKAGAMAACDAHYGQRPT